MPDQSVSRRLRRTTVVYSAVVMFAVGLVVALVGVLPLTKRLRVAEQRNLLVEVHARMADVEQFVVRVKAAAWHAASRTRVREGLEALTRAEGRPPEWPLPGEPVLRDSMTVSADVEGISLFDFQNNLVLQVGREIPAAQRVWPEPTAREPIIRGPIRIGSEAHLVASAPVVGQKLRRIGTAMVLYRGTDLQRAIEARQRLGRTGEVVLGAPSRKDSPFFFAPRQGSSLVSANSARFKTLVAALKLASHGRTDVFTPSAPFDDSLVLAYGPIKGTDWAVVVSKQKWELFWATNRTLVVVGCVLAGLIITGTAGMVFILRPLTSRLLLQADELESQIYEKTAALNTELAERKRAEESLRDSEALYHSLVDTLPINVLRKDLKGRVTFGNKSYCDAMGMKLDQLVGKTDRDLFPPELAEKYVRDDDKVVNTGQVFEGIEQHRTPDGKRLYVHVIKAPVRDARSNIVGTQVIFWDETARQLAEQERQRALADLARSNKDLEQFAYVASHDLQEPLRMIASYTELLSRRYRSRLDPEADEFIGYAVEGAKRMYALINDLLAYSRIGIHGRPFAVTDCNEVLHGSLERLKASREESRAVIRAEPLPKVMGDEAQLSLLFENLLSNALKYRSQSTPTICISAVLKPCPPAAEMKDAPSAADPLLQEWVFAVRDNGIGIEKQYHERVFGIFQRLHGRHEYAGTGVGLAICRKIIERHGGRIWIESELGRGSTFYFSIPHITEFSI